MLWSISPKLVVFLLSYALLGTVGTAAVFGAPLTRLKQKLLRLEADLRFGLVRLRCAADVGTGAHGCGAAGHAAHTVAETLAETAVPACSRSPVCMRVHEVNLEPSKSFL